MDIIVNIIYGSMFIWLPTILGFVFWRTYLEYKRQSYVNNKIKYKMLEISIPKDVHKSPEAMEIIIDILHHFGGGGMSPKHRIWMGSQLHPGSLEIVSIEGSVYFFIRASTQIADLVKSTIYSQYPNAEVNEVDDYTKYVPNYNFHEDAWDVFGIDYRLAGPNFVPIKTYVDYGLDKSIGSLEEEQKIDPLTPMLEFLGTLRSGEQMWIQIIVRADPFSNWRKEAEDYIRGLLGRAEAVADDAPFQTVKMSHGEQEQVKSIERSLSKLGFEAVIRAIYLSRKDVTSKTPVGFLKGPVFKPFSSQYLNGFKKSSDTTAIDWVWQDVTGRRAPKMRRDAFTDYVSRTSFYDPLLNFSKPWTFFNVLFPPKSTPMILTSEELATLFHIPGRVSETTSVARIDATKAEPPVNLPL